ncbi:MAG: RNA ligase RtcB family protein [Deltaproteobacteria bacterium]|nr:RNA ligase RtcB family protein [Deltaproteobacteria bacterium]
MKENKTNIKIIASEKNWIEGEAIQQLNNTAKLEGMLKVVGLPDLHPGRGNPVGAVFVIEDKIYPYLVGNDVGCGMGFWQTNLKRKKIKLDKWVKKLEGLESQWKGDTDLWLKEFDLQSSSFDYSLGTVGGGNHFAELQLVEKVKDREAFGAMKLEKDALFLLVHSGSRGLGEKLLRTHVDRYEARGLEVDSEDCDEYIKGHNYAVNWAVSNRALIAHRFLSMLSSEGRQILDSCHNSVTPVTFASKDYWLHRKGAAPSDNGPLIIPGSRGTFSYLVHPCGGQEDNAYSLAHGAGRKWKRSDAKDRLRRRFNKESLSQTEFGGRVICEDKNLLYEEAPQAYKNVDIVISDMVDAGLIRVIATLKPLITYKTRVK